MLTGGALTDHRESPTLLAWRRELDFAGMSWLLTYWPESPWPRTVGGEIPVEERGENG